MELHNIKPAAGSVKKPKRIARGQGSGHGGTSTRGHKGAKSRSGDKRKRGFEGGQMPLQRRIPKRGFNNINNIEYVPLNLGILDALSKKHGISDFTLEALREIGTISKMDKVKILGSGELTTKLNITAHAFSESAKKAIELLGGTANLYTKQKNEEAA